MTNSSRPSSPVEITEASTVGTGRLALTLQEALTAVTRIGSDRHPVPDAAAFRARMLQLLQRAGQEAGAAGYDPTDVRLAVFAVVALLDELALNSRQAALAEWARRPLQQELFGGLMAGEWFYQHIEQLLARPDSAALADVLEVYQLCLLLGFRGRYGSDPGALYAVASRVGERINRLRGAAAGPELVSGWRPGNDAVAGRDPWIRRLTIGLAAGVALVVLTWGVSAMSLRGSSATVAALATSR